MMVPHMNAAKTNYHFSDDAGIANHIHKHDTHVNTDADKHDDHYENSNDSTEGVAAQVCSRRQDGSADGSLVRQGNCFIKRRG